MEIIKPELLKMLIKKDSIIKTAVAILKDDCQSVMDDRKFQSDRLGINDVQMAKKLNAAELFDSKIDFNDYSSVHEFIVKNSNFLDQSAQQWLLKPFE